MLPGQRHQVGHRVTIDQRTRRPQPRPQHRLRAMHERLLDLDARLRTPAPGDRTIDPKNLPDTRQQEEQRNRTVRLTRAGQREHKLMADPRGIAIEAVENELVDMVTRYLRGDR